MSKFGHLVVQQVAVLIETHPQHRPDFYLWLYEKLEIVAKEYGLNVYQLIEAVTNGE